MSRSTPTRAGARRVLSGTSFPSSLGWNVPTSIRVPLYPHGAGDVPSCAVNGAACHDSAVPGAGAAATLQCYWREYFVYSKECHITAVNGQRPTLRLWESGVFTASVPLGRQWIEIEMQAFAFGGGGTTDVCAFEHNFLPGVHYRIRPGSEAFEISATQKHNPALAPYRGSLVIESASTEQASQRVDLSCTHGGGSLCRSTGDCVKHPNVRCERREGEAFGKCAAGAGH
ncbi:hypothetical protein [Ideonella sp.]|uniref:hypothetical protein n=1 Tax=Ideonella sp. TaxID=1929293 RepID=UPI0035AF15C4